MLRVRLHRPRILRWIRRVPRRVWLYALAAVLAPWLAALAAWYGLLPFRMLFGIELILPRVP